MPEKSKKTDIKEKDSDGKKISELIREVQGLPEEIVAAFLKTKGALSQKK